MEQTIRTDAHKKIMNAMTLGKDKLIKVTGGRRDSMLPAFCPYCGGTLECNPTASHEYEEAFCTGCGKIFVDEPLIDELRR